MNLTKPMDVHNIKVEWLEVLQDAEAFILSRPPDEAGCLYFETQLKRFVDPRHKDAVRVVKHFGRPGGVVPRILE